MSGEVIIQEGSQERKTPKQRRIDKLGTENSPSVIYFVPVYVFRYQFHICSCLYMNFIFSQTKTISFAGCVVKKVDLFAVNCAQEYFTRNV